jgi:hypothetical protein
MSTPHQRSALSTCNVHAVFPNDRDDDDKGPGDPQGPLSGVFGTS